MRNETSFEKRRTQPGRIRIQSSSREDGGSALVIAAMFCAIASLIFVSVLSWAANYGRLVRHQQEFLAAQYVAEAGVEKVFAAIRSNLNATGVSPNQTTLNLYATNQLPTSADNSLFSSYQFITSGGVTNQITVTTTGTSTMSVVPSGTYAGLNALTTPYTIKARANSYNRPVNLTTGVQRDIQIQSIPVFQFAVFYNGTLEILPGAAMIINGRIHCNADSYISPVVSLTVGGNVTSVGNVNDTPPPSLLYTGSPYLATRATPVFDGTVTPDTSSLNLPIQSSTPDAILDPPPGGSDPISAERLYNQAGLRIMVSNSGITVTDGSGNAVSGITVANGSISTNKTLYNFREQKTITLTEVDISKLISNGKIPVDDIIYIADTRNAPAETAVRLINGSSLPAGGLTVGTENPIYILGNYNSAADAPSSILADAINILSGSWNDANSSAGIGSRVASSTTVNAAFYTGNVPTAGTVYSGGLENLPRFLEDWTGKTFTYAGSMVCMFASKFATGSQANASYGAPTRNWSFDNQFLNGSTLPPGTPSIRTLARTDWASTQ